MMGGWGCPYQVNLSCRRLSRECDPGIPGCILYGLVERKDVPPSGRTQRRAISAKTPDPAPPDGEDRA